MSQGLANRKVLITLGFLLISSGLLVVFTRPVLTPAETTPFEDSQRLNALLRANDPLAYAMTLMAGYLDIGRRVLGKINSPDQLRHEGLWFFELTNPYTGAPIANRCDAPSPGDYCLKLSSSYGVDKFVFYDPVGNEIVYPGLKAFTIRPEDRRASSSWNKFFAGNPSSDKIKALALGTYLGWVYWRMPVAQSEGATGFTKLLSQPPLNRLYDPWTGQVIPFDGKGFGERLKLTMNTSNSFAVTIYLPDGSVGYQEEFIPLGSAGNSLAFSVIHHPVVSPTLVRPDDF
ncbi:MAG: hypothetical protein V2G42_04775 [bacterium JZ-2024 1]